MQKIIDGKMFDTETAEWLGEYNDYLGSNNHRHISEDLYRTSKGNFFLHYEGGGLTKYAVFNGNGRCSGIGILPISEDEAKKWCEKHMESDEYIELFGSPEEA